MLSLTEENYLKAIYHLSDGGAKAVLTNAIAEAMETKPASVTDMVKRLATKNLINYEPYHGAHVTKHGKAEALNIIRKHRLWETFLVDKLGFHWDEVHDVAEQLEHIHSPVLIEKLDEFLGHPLSDPHGDPIPDKNGKIHITRQIPISEASGKKTMVVRAVKDSSPAFLQYLNKIGIQIGTTIKIIEKNEYDNSLEIVVDGKKKSISKEVSENILINE
jgi:DtxR family transcriptional regulator, Mn-dependent transcriptional regulator